MRIQHNIAALNSHRQLGGNNNAVGKNLEKLSSGYKINRAGDDAAGLAISEKMRAQIRGLETAQKNAQDGISLVQTAEGALTEVHSMLNRMVELATQSSNGTYTEDDRAKLQNEVVSLREEVDRIAQGTDFNGIKLLDGSLGKSTAAFAGFDKDVLETAAKAIITDMGGISLKSGDTVGMETTTGSKIKVTTTDAAGKGTVKVIDIADLIKQADGSAWTGAKGQAGTLDLTSIGLGKIDIVSTDAAGTAANIATDLVTAFGTPVTGTDAVAGATGTGLKLQVGDTNEGFQKVEVSIGSMSSESLGIDGVDVGTELGAGNAIDSIKAAINQVSATRGNLGAIQNRLEHTINNLGVTTENMTAAESRIRDVDMAKEMMDFTKNNILTQAAQAMLAQANQIPQGVLQLLR